MVRHSSEARIALVPPASIEDRPLLWMVVRSHTYYPEHILIILSTYLLMGAGRLITLLSWVLALSGPTLGVGIRWRSEHHTETGSQVLEAWSPSLDGDLDPLIGVGRVGSVYA